MVKGPRVGDIGTKIILHIIEDKEPLDVSGATAKIEIISPLGKVSYDAEVNETSISYIGKPTDNLWPRSGKYKIQGVVEWGEVRKFTTGMVKITVV